MKTTSFLHQVFYNSQAGFTCRACVTRGTHQEQVGDDGVLEGDVRDSVNGRDGAGLDTVQIIQYLPPTQLKLSDFNQNFRDMKLLFCSKICTFGSRQEHKDIRTRTCCVQYGHWFFLSIPYCIPANNLTKCLLVLYINFFTINIVLSFIVIFACFFLKITAPEEINTFTCNSFTMFCEPSSAGLQWYGIDFPVHWLGNINRPRRGVTSRVNGLKNPPQITLKRLTNGGLLFYWELDNCVAWKSYCLVPHISEASLSSISRKVTFSTIEDEV